MDIRLICTDVDGTLLSDSLTQAVPPLNAAMLQKAHEKGIRVALVSGRAKGGLDPIWEKIGFSDLTVCYNGGLVYDADGSVAFRRPMDKSLALKTLSVLRTERSLSTFVFGTEGWYKERQGLWEAKEDKAACRGIPAPSLEEAVERTENVYKLLSATDDQEAVCRAMEKLGKLPLSVSQSDPRYIEIMPEGVDKGLGVRALMHILGIGAESILAFGDFWNDVPMLRAVGHPVAMGQAPEGIKKIAETVAPRNTEAGLGTVIARYLAKGVIA